MNGTSDLDNAQIVIAGGSGFLGVSLSHHLAELGADVTILSRNKPKVSGPWRHAVWNGRTLGTWQSELNGATALVNLAGRSVDCIKTPDNKDQILRSRVESTRVLGQAVRAIESPPPVWVQMSTAHIYGDPPTAVCDEDSAFGCGLAPMVAKAWEDEFERAKLPDQRTVVVRTSFVCGRNRGSGGGALDTLGWLARLGFGGRVGSGKQGFSWIHERDMNRIFERAICDSTMSGAYNATAPNPVSQADFMRELRKTVGMPIGIPAFEWMVRIGAPLMLKTDPELALYGRYVVPSRLQSEGFKFELPILANALEKAMGKAGG